MYMYTYICIYTCICIRRAGGLLLSGEFGGLCFFRCHRCERRPRNAWPGHATRGPTGLLTVFGRPFEYMCVCDIYIYIYIYV